MRFIGISKSSISGSSARAWGNSVGQPIAASGDLFGEVGYDFGSAHPANITIDRIVP